MGGEVEVKRMEGMVKVKVKGGREKERKVGLRGKGLGV